MPDNCNSCGELIAPPARITSAFARKHPRLATPAIFHPHRAAALDHHPRASAPVTTDRFARCIAGRRKARAAEFRRAPLIVIW
jgi:hypothetical protein